jgi:hypothetical protein
VQEAEVLRVLCPDPGREITAARQYSLTLRVGEREVIAEPWLPGMAVPEVGSRIKVVIGADVVALDTDERYDGPPGQAIVWTPPPEVLTQRRQEPSLGSQIAAQQAFVEGQHAKLEQFEAKRAAYEAGQLPPPSDASFTPAAAPATDDLLGRLDQQLAQMKQARGVMGKRYEKTVRKLLDTYLRTGQIDEAGYQERLARALAESG